MTKSLKIALLLLFLFQVFISAGFELAHDEAYYWLYSLHLDWGFFDHPPFVAWVIKLFSFLPHAEWSLRLGFIILQFLTLFMLMGLTSLPWLTSLLYFSFPLASFTGLLALPDIPLLFMTGCYCYGLRSYLKEDGIKNSLLLGTMIALLFYAKYHGILLIFFTLLALPGLFKRRSFYLVALTALVAFLPHVFWEYKHDFATLRYHFLERPSSTFSLGRSLEFLALQVVLAGVFAGPVVWWIVLKTKTASSFDRAMKSIALGTVLFFLFSTFSKKPEANWTIFLTFPLIYLAASSSLWSRMWCRALLYASFTLVVAARILLVLPPELFSLNRLREFHGWNTWAHKVEGRCEAPLVANTYQLASKLSFYLNREIGSINYHSRKNQFDYWKFEEKLPTKEVCYLTDKRDFEGEEILTPEGKKLKLVKKQSLSALRSLKSALGDR